MPLEPADFAGFAKPRFILQRAAARALNIAFLAAKRRVKV
jgi:hypothetical protein